MRKSVLALVLGIAATGSLMAQHAKSYWHDASETRIPRGTRQIIPAAYRTVKLDLNSLQSLLQTAPMEYTTEAINQQTILELPMPDGTTQRFDVELSPIMEAPLAEQFPAIKTYRAYGIDDATAYCRLDLTPQGFHAMVLTHETSAVFIDPYQKGNTEYYISYYKKDFRTDKQFICNFGADMFDHDHDAPEADHGTGLRYGDCQKRTYRLALACTVEYGTFHGGTTASVLAAMNTTMNRVNGVYEKDLAVRLNIIANNTAIIYTSGTDPYTNNDGAAMLTQNQTNLTNVIGSANYDMGHVFSTGGGGIASYGSVCSSTRKAQGVTGSPSPVGDPFDIDYVAHEMGHQFGGSHTFNSDQGSCGGGNRNNSTAWEVGSGSTIMAYAGICSPDNVQNNSDPYFHGGSIAEMSNFYVTGTGNGCAAITASNNSAPVVSTATTTYTIPVNTPFLLTATATDANNSTGLTYCWEQFDNQINNQPPVATNTNGPQFRTYNPTTSPTRYFPRLSNILAGQTSNTWEVLPSVTRNMTFKCSVRDNNAGAGCTGSSGTITVATNAAAGPFVVTVPNATGISYPGLSTQTVTWNVANTTASPVSCATVDILLSTDGGNTYPTTLASNVPNSGSAAVTMPGVVTTTARVMVICHGNIFFDVSNNNFAITNATPDFTVSASPSSVASCGNTSVTSTITVNTIQNFTGNVALTVSSGLPAGATATFAPSTVAAGSTSTLTLSGLGAVTAGTYTLTIQGAGSTGNRTTNLTLIVIAGAPAATTLSSPGNAATGQSQTPTLTWTAVSGASTYDLDIATDAAFTAIVSTQSGLTGTSYTVSPSLATNTTYYWRVRAVNSCGNSAYSTRSFTTLNVVCSTYTNNTAVTISASGTPTVTSTIAVPAVTGTISDVNVTNLQATHTWVSDLRFTLASPAATSVRLMDQVCNDNSQYQNVNIKFDDASANAYANIPCAPTDGLVYVPNQALSAFNTQTATGNWVLTVNDLANQDGGTLNSWAIQICVLQQPVCTVTATAAATTTSCTANTGTATATPSGGTAPYTYAWSNNATTQTATGLGLGAYTVTVTDGAGCTTTASATVSSVNPPSITASASAAACVGGNVTLTGGGGATYVWSGPNGFSSTSASPVLSNITAATAGTYTVTGTDANGCAATASATVSVNALPTATASATSPCAGSTLQLNATGGGTYAWAGPSSFTATTANPTRANATSAMDGTYTVTVTNASGCSASATTTVTIGATPTATATNAGPYCSGTAIQLTSSGGNTYSWSGPANYVASAQNPVRTGASANFAGVYTVTVSNANGCTATASTTVVVNTSPALATSATNATCFGQANGSINLTVTGGNSGLVYNWSNATTLEDPTGLAPGSYTVTVTNSNGCSATASSTISQPSQVVATATATGSTGTDGTATASATGGLAPYTYAWSGTTATTAAVTGLAPGTYTVTVSDARGCTSTASAVVDNNTATLNLANITAFSVLPNPSNGEFVINLAFNRTEDVRIEIFAANGQLVRVYAQSGSTLSIPVDIRDTAAGTYLLRFTTTAGTATYSVIKH